MLFRNFRETRPTGNPLAGQTRCHDLIGKAIEVLGGVLSFGQDPNGGDARRSVQTGMRLFWGEDGEVRGDTRMVPAAVHNLRLGLHLWSQMTGRVVSIRATLMDMTTPDRPGCLCA
jgi:hypothetical protein